jgi:HSP20 family protein
VTAQGTSLARPDHAKEDVMAESRKLGRVMQQPMMMGSMMRSPFSLIRRMMEDMDRLFDEAGYGRELGMGMEVWNPAIEVREQDGKLLVRADLPGVAKEDVRVNLEGDSLVIEGERKREEEKEEGGVYHSERFYGSFARRIPLPVGVDLSKCEADYDSGVLEVKIPLPKEARRSIAIGGGEGQKQQLPAKTGEQQKQAGATSSSKNGPTIPPTR